MAAKKSAAGRSAASRTNAGPGSLKTGQRRGTSGGKPNSAAAASRERGSSGASSLVVRIGASAGGLEALEELLENLPAATGMAFVVITHQHPGHTSLLPELLGKCTEMPVVQARDSAPLEPNCVHVAPPGGHVAVINGALRLMRGPRGSGTVAQRPEQKGYEVDVSARIADALCRMVSREYDFVVSDPSLPGARGYGLRDLLFLLEPRTRVLVISGKNLPQGFRAYPSLSRPVQFSELMRALQA